MNIQGHKIGGFTYAAGTDLLPITTGRLKDLNAATKKQTEKKGLLLNIRELKYWTATEMEITGGGNKIKM